MDKPLSWQDIFSWQEVQCILLYSLTAGLGLVTDVLLEEVQAMPQGWQQLNYSDVSLIVFRFLLIPVYTSLFVYAAYRYAACYDWVYWRLVALFLFVFLMDWESVVDARTGLPEPAQDGAIKIIQGALMDNTNLEATLVGLLQNTRAMKTSTCAFGYRVFDMLIETRLLNYQTLVSYACPIMYNLLLACQFCICSDDDFLTLF